MKKFLLLILSIFVLVGCESINPSDGTKTSDTEKTIAIIETNDLHGFMLQDENGKLGLSNMSYLVNERRSTLGKDNVLFIANGDMLQGTAVAKLSYGQVMIDALGEMGLDAFILGNHEFDWGLDKVLTYFDGNEDNGEAKFPLINSNLYNTNNELVLLPNGQVYESYMFDKNGVKIGVIGYLGNVKDSINQLVVLDYEFNLDYVSLTTRIGSKLKDDGADVIVVAIHGGNSSSVASYNPNNDIAQIKYKGKYLVDACINGHTHTYQDGYIKRSGGVAMPVVQSQGYASNQVYAFGEIDLTLNSKNEVVNTKISHLEARTAKNNYDQACESVIQAYYERDKETIETPVVIADTAISRYSEYTYKWASNVILSATGADVAICNTGAFRTNLTEGTISFDEMYEFNPFDNHIILHRCSRRLVEQFLIDNESYYFYGTTSNYADKDTVLVAIVDYVYYSTYYGSVRAEATNYNDSCLIMRDLMIEDLKLRSHFNVARDYEALIGKKVS